jgi:hypothetical protein
MSRASRFADLISEYGKAAVDEVLSALGRDAEPEMIKKAVAQRAAAAAPEKRAAPAKVNAPVKTPAKAPLAVKPQGITAYHGSPHSFDRFSLDKIGTGEGAQAYGHGLYFAENEGAARRYRESLSGKLDNPLDMRGVDGAWVAAAKDMRGAGYDESKVKSVLGQTYKKATPAQIDAAFQMSDPGSMYQVRIDADPADFLDWDAPLSRQKKAFEAVRRFADDTFSGDAFDLQDMLAIKNTKAGDILKQMERTAENPERAAEVLKKAGVPGIKYLDQGSRAAGDGSRNYVVFDDKLISILKKYGWAPGMAIPAAAMAEYEAEQELARGGLAAKYGC